MTSSSTASLAGNSGALAPPVEDRTRPLDADTIAFRIVGDLRLGFMLGSGLLMQTLHPVVGAGVAEHSIYESRPWERLFSSLMPILGCVYDGLDAADTGKRVRAAHKNIKGVDAQGRKYHAMDPDAYGWVWATIFDAVVRMREVFAEPLSPSEQTEFYWEWRYVGLTMGLRPQDMPPSLDAFRVYYERMIHERLEHGEVPDTVLAMIASVPPPPYWPLGQTIWRVVRTPVCRAMVNTTKGTLPEEVRRAIGIEWSGRDMLEFAVYATVIRAVFALLPRRISYFPRAARGRRQARLPL
ncbi:oxygenase MpaB family protein [Nocardia sp. IFM 10818]